MKKIGRNLSWVVLIMAGLFALAGLYQWRKSPAQDTGRWDVVPVDFKLPPLYKPEKMDRVTEPQTRDPFSETPIASESPRDVVSSNLILLGTVTGQNPRAVMAEKANPARTYIIRPGGVCLGEKVDTIGKGYVIIWKDGHKLTIQSTP